MRIAPAVSGAALTARENTTERAAHTSYFHVPNLAVFMNSSLNVKYINVCVNVLCQEMQIDINMYAYIYIYVYI